MKGKSISALIFSFGITVVGLLMQTVVPRAEAQSGCTPFEAIVQANLPSPLPLVSQDDSWGGPIYATLGGEFLAGNISGNEVGSVHGTIGMGTDTTYKVCFGQIGDCTNSFTYEAKNAVWPYQPGKVGMGYYQANSAKIVQGTGRFQNASGNLNVAGPFIVWTPDNGITWLACISHRE